MKKSFAFLCGAVMLSSIAFAQSDTSKTSTTPTTASMGKVVKPIQLAGPRVGLTYIFPGKTVDVLKDDLDMTPFFTQFGWQFEHQYFALDNGVAGLVEFVGLIGGLEQGRFLPSANLLIGVRGAQGGEFAFGPNLSLTGASFVFAVGHTYKMGSLNFPVNFAVVPSTNGFRASILLGFNAQTR